MALTQTEVSKLYVSIFGRASEGEGNKYWQTNGGDTLAEVADSMLETDAAKEYFGAALNSHQQIVEFIYQNTLGKDPAKDPEGVSYWVDRLDSGDTVGKVVADLVTAVEDYKDSTDEATKAAYDQFMNRVAVSDYCAEHQEKFTGEYDPFKDFITSVTSDPATVDSAKEKIEDFVADHVEELKLTTEIDNIVMTEEQHNLVGIIDTNNSVSTLNAGDSIDGQNIEGSELRVVLDAKSYAGTAKIKNLDKLTVQLGAGAAQSFNMSGTENIKEVVMEQAVGAQTINNANSLDTVYGIRNTTQNFTLSYLNSILDGDEDEAKISLEEATGGSSNQTITVSNGIEKVALTVKGGKSDVADVTDGTADGSLKELSINAENDLRIRALDADIATIDATESTGGVRVSSTNTGNVTFTGGKGDDRITLATGTFNEKDVIDGGEGTDRLDINFGSTSASKVNQIKNIENIAVQATADVSLELKDVTGVNTVTVVENSAADDIKITKLETALENINYEGNGTDASQTFDNLKVSLSTDGESDSTAVNVSNVDATGKHIAITGSTNGYNLGTLDVNGVENLSFNVEDGRANILNIVDSDLETLSIKSSSDFSIQNKFTANKDFKSLDALDVEGNFQANIDASASTSNVSVSIKDGDADVITGKGNDNISFSGYGDNKINAGAGADIIETGSGHDTLIASSIFNAADNVSDFEGGKDKFIIDIKVGTNADAKWGTLNTVGTKYGSGTTGKKLTILTASQKDGKTAGTAVTGAANKIVTYSNGSKSSKTAQLTAKMIFTGKSVKTYTKNKLVVATKVTTTTTASGATNKKTYKYTLKLTAATALVFFYDTDDRKLEVFGAKGTTLNKTFATLTFANGSSFNETDFYIM
jgi:hypothetical protein